MRTVLFILLGLFGIQNFAQQAKIEARVKEIDNSQFTITHIKPSNFSINSKAVHKLINIGKPATEQLIAALNDSTKIIMAHLVLCHIWLKHASFAGPKIISTLNGDVAKYYLGEEKGEGLLISEIKKPDGTYVNYIEANDKEKIKTYWNKKTSKAK